jgi:hypothetical protein
MSGAGKGDVELIIAVVGFIIVGVLLVISIVTGVVGRGGAGKWVAGTAGALVVTVGLLSYI